MRSCITGSRPQGGRGPLEVGPRLVREGSMCYRWLPAGGGRTEPPTTGLKRLEKIAENPRRGFAGGLCAPVAREGKPRFF